MAPSAAELTPSYRLRGMGIGSLFLSFFGGVWMLAALNGQSLTAFFAGVFLPVSLLVVRSIGLLLASRELRAAPEALAARSRRGRRFGLIFALEALAILIAANALARVAQGAYILPAVGCIVGAHFIPLAKLFRHPVYYATGAAQMALCAATALLLRRHLDVIDGFIGWEMGLTLWLTALVVLVQAWRLRARLEPAGR